METNKIIDDGSCIERFSGSLGNEPFINEEMSDFLIRTMIESILETVSVTQDELSRYSIEEEDVEKYGLEHLVAGGYKKRSK